MSNDRPPRPSGRQGERDPQGRTTGPRRRPPPPPQRKTTGSRPALSSSSPDDANVIDLDALQAVLRDPSLKLLKGKRFDRYELIDEIARGGMGVVVRARHTELGSLVALKLLAQQAPTPEAVARFRREARVLAQIKHANVVGISDLGEERGVAFLAMELVEGPSLQRWVEAQRASGQEVEFKRAVEIVLAMAQALAYCHESGAVHRDVKPHNILIEEGTGRSVLTDFGLVKRDKASQGQSSSITGALDQGKILGTPSYMSPEQFEPDGEFGEVGPKSDVYGLGAVLYYCLTGQPPFTARNVVDLYGQVTGEAPLPPSELRLDVPQSLDELTLACLVKPVVGRLEMKELVSRLEALLANPKALQPRRSGAGRALGVVVLLLAAAAVHLTFIQPAQGERLWALLRGVQPTPSPTPAPSATPLPSGIPPEKLLDEAKRLLALSPPQSQAALTLLRGAGARGEPAAWVWLGQLYAEGKQGVPRDLTEAVRCFRKGAAANNPTALLWLGVLNRDGRGLPKDLAQAKVLFLRAVEVAGPEHRAVQEQAEKYLAQLEELMRAEEPSASASPSPSPSAPSDR